MNVLRLNYLVACDRVAGVALEESAAYAELLAAARSAPACAWCVGGWYVCRTALARSPVARDEQVLCAGTAVAVPCRGCPRGGAIRCVELHRPPGHPERPGPPPIDELLAAGL